jgi:membrane protease subunit HflC
MNKDVNKKAKETDEQKKSSGLVLKLFLALVLIVVVIYFGFTCIVREGNCAVILRFGAPRADITEPGMYFKLPRPFEQVYTYDNRTQYLESNALETPTKDNRTIILQSYSTWSISDPLKFHNKIGSKEKVETYIKDQIFSATNSVIGAYELTGILSLNDRSNVDADSNTAQKQDISKLDEIQEKIFQSVKQTCEANYGIKINDVSILRIILPDTNLQSVFEQMKADRQKDIDTIIAQAQRDADVIISDADREYAEIIAGSQIEASEIYKKTEEEVAKLYAEAQAANMELYQFLKELDSIVASVSADSVLIVTKDTYPFNVLLNYGNTLTDENDEVIIEDLEYILTQLPEADREALTKAIYDLIDEAKTNSGIGG